MKIGIIGFGSLGRSLMTGLIKGGINKEDILVCDPSVHRENKAKDMGIAVADSTTVVCACDAVVFAVPKAAFDEMEMDWTLFDDKIVFSCMAEVKMSQLKQRFDGRVVRVIPTLGAENGISIVGICFDEQTEEKEEIKQMFRKVGTVIECKEDELSTITALAACGLCYAAYILNSFINTAENLGFDREKGQEIVEKTFRSAMEMGDYELLIGKIAARGGITIKGVNVMNEGNVHKTIDTAFKTAYREFIK
ncbi:MAG: NAD(P)-binding domain-containing protein [Oscillospiraceae bacterium]|nr:NAD(P)-binding domain-containing protein [Oscillospiraceae bacterium]